MQIRVKTPTDGGEAEFLTEFYCDYKKYCLNLRKRTLTSERMNIRLFKKQPVKQEKDLKLIIHYLKSIGQNLKSSE